MRFLLTLLLSALVATALACDTPRRQQQTIEPRTAGAPAGDAADNATDNARADEPDRPVMARVNGEPVYMAALHEALVEDFGKPIAQHLVANKVVEQALVEKGLPTNVTDAQIQRQTRETLRLLFNFDAPPSPDQLENLLGQLLQQRGLTRRIWDATMHRNVQLERLAAAEVDVSNSELLREFNLQYGAKWRVRHIQVANLDTARDIRQQLLDGADFEALAFKHSTNPDARRGALLPDISPRDEQSMVDRSIRQAALAMTQPGEISHPVQAGTSFHVLKLEKIIPPKEADFQNVRADLQAAVRERKMAQRVQELLQTLIAESEIEYIDPTLQEVMQRGESND